MNKETKVKSIEVSTLEISVKGQKLRLSPEDARALMWELESVLGTTRTYFPNPIVIIQPVPVVTQPPIWNPSPFISPPNFDPPYRITCGSPGSVCVVSDGIVTN